MNKGIITLSTPKSAIEDDIKALREQYKQDGYMVNIIKIGSTLQKGKKLF